jgi:hypothetical protein
MKSRVESLAGVICIIYMILQVVCECECNQSEAAASASSYCVRVSPFTAFYWFICRNAACRFACVG